MTTNGQVVPNYKTIEGFLNQLSEEYDLESRLNRYTTMTPELIELVQKQGLKTTDQAVHALFIADFVITSSEVTSGVSDDDRRISIAKSFVIGLDERVDDSMKILEAFYLAQKLYVSLKRNDSYLAGRGIRADDRALILMDMYLRPFFIKLQDVLGSGDCNWEVGILKSMIHKEPPLEFVTQYMESVEFPLKSPQLVEELHTIISEFIRSHDAELNPDSPLPNVNETSALYQVNIEEDIHLSLYNLSTKITKASVEQNKVLHRYLDKNDETHALVFMRGKILNSQKHLVLSRNPYVEGKPLILFKSPVSDINTTEAFELLKIRSEQDAGLLRLKSSETINESYFETVQKEVVELQDKVIEVEEEVKVPVKEQKDQQLEEDKPKKKKRGFFGKLKSLIFGGDDDDNNNDEDEDQTRTEKRKVARTVQEEVKKTVKEEVERKKRIGVRFPDSVVETLGVYLLEDLRIFEEFDTLREAEYEIIGALESDFERGTTSVLSTSKFENAEEIFTLLDGLDRVVEAVANYYYDTKHQLIPEEMLFLSKENQHFILTLDGNERGLVATLAQTYSSEITNWQNSEKVDTVQRRTLQMRTGQLLSAREHTPFDRAATRIYGDALGENTSIDTIDRAILSLDD